MENNLRQGRNKRRRRAAGILAAVLILLIAAISFMSGGRRIRSDSPEVEWTRQGELITQVTVEARFPCSRVIPRVMEESIQDSAGNTVEIIQTYTFDAKFSLRLKGTYKINIENSGGIPHTYVLKFEDRDVVIKNGREVG